VANSFPPTWGASCLHSNDQCRDVCQQREQEVPVRKFQHTTGRGRRALRSPINCADINFGCPQDIARRGKYGAFLQDDWELVHKLINILHVNLSIPVTAKFRVFPSVEKTVAYAKMMESAGAQILACHGRIREQRGHHSGLADWAKIRAVKEAVSVPVFANGNILYHADIQRCLDATGADAVMSAEGNLYNPAIFSSSPATLRHADLALEYLDIVKSLKTPISLGAIKSHLFKLFRPSLDLNKDLRDRLGKIHGKPGSSEWMEEFTVVTKEMKQRMDRDADEAGDIPEHAAPHRELPDGTPAQDIPHWRVQPYLRAPTPPPSAKKAAALASVPRTSGPGVVRLAADDPVTSRPPYPLEIRKRAAEAASESEEGSKRVKH